MQSKCQYPHCPLKQHGTFALVPLCRGHLQAIWDETHAYYKANRQRNYERDRPEYHKISKLIPWSIAMLGEVDRNGKRRQID